MEELKAFMSYTRFDNKHDGERLTQFRKYLGDEVRAQTGEEFPIFQDIENIQWGQDFKKRIGDAIKEVTFLIPIITPSFFKSQYCREELEQFLKREEQLRRDDLILPVYYIECPVLEDESGQATDELARVIAARQYVDWRDLRFESFESPKVRKKLMNMAVQVRAAMERVQQPLPSGTPGLAPGVGKTTSGQPPVPAEVGPPFPSVVEGGEKPEEAQPEEKGEPFWRKISLWVWAFGGLAVLVVGVIMAGPSVRGYFAPTPVTRDRAATVAPVVLRPTKTTPSPSPAPTSTPTITPNDTPMPTHTPTTPPTDTPTPIHTPIPPTNTPMPTHTPTTPPTDKPTPIQMPVSPTAAAAHTPRPPASTPPPTAPSPSTGPITLTIYLRDTVAETGVTTLSGDQVNGGMVYEEGKFVYGEAAVQIGDTVYHFDKPEVGPGEPEQLPDPWRAEFEFAKPLVERTGSQAGSNAKKAQFWVGALDGDSSVGEDNPYSLTMKLYEGDEFRKSIQVFFAVADVPGGGGSSGGGGGKSMPTPP